MFENFQDLADAIILSAVKDYRKALRLVNLYSNNETAKYDIKSIEQFFRSEYFKVLTNIDAEYLIKKLRTETTKKGAKL